MNLSHKIYDLLYVGCRERTTTESTCSHFISTSYIIQSIAKVGHYGIRITWNDNHNTGIYSYQYMYELSEQ